MSFESPMGDFAVKVHKSLRIMLIRNLSIAALVAVGGAAKLFSAKHPVPDHADPQNPEKVKKISCLTCHGARAGGAGAVLITGPAAIHFILRPVS